MPKDKSPSNDELTKNFFQFLWHNVKVRLISSFRRTYYRGKFSSPERETLIRLTENKDQDKRCIQN